MAELKVRYNDGKYSAILIKAGDSEEIGAGDINEMLSGIAKHYAHRKLPYEKVRLTILSKREEDRDCLKSLEDMVRIYNEHLVEVNA